MCELEMINSKEPQATSRRVDASTVKVGRNRHAMWTLIIITSLFISTDGLVVKVDIPNYAEVGGGATLRCLPTISRGRLYSVRWYKDEKEFCRFYPDTLGQVFPAPGLFLQTEDCLNTTVRLRDLTRESSGVYKCEISVRGPEFKSVISGQPMSVIAFPSSDPIISGVLPLYREGQFVTAMCTSSPSNPPSQLSWFINGSPAENWLIYKYPVEETETGLYRSAMGLRFLAERWRFGYRGTASIMCTATLGHDLPPWQAAASLKLYVEGNDDGYGGGYPGGYENIASRTYSSALIQLLLSLLRTIFGP